MRLLKDAVSWGIDHRDLTVVEAIGVDEIHWRSGIRVLRGRLGPTKKVARSLRSHREWILAWFRARGTISAGIVEGFQDKATLITKKAFGFRTEQGIEIALYRTLGNLPEPEFTLGFC